jgi:hypothetical protein
MHILVVSKYESMAGAALWSLVSGSNIMDPKQIQAVYLPAWIVDAEVKTNAWLEGSARVG